MALEIRKKAVKNFEHIYNSYKLTFSDLRIAFNGTTQNVLITRENGAFVIKRDGFNVTEISVYDETEAGTEETFVNVTVLANRLIEIGYIAFYTDNDIVINDLISNDAGNSLTIGTDGLLYVPAGGVVDGLPAGGTTGQILKKQSNTDFDADWEDETGGSVQSVTGDSVDNTDPNNPVVNAIPLSGTEVGSPVNGDIEFDPYSGSKLLSTSDDGTPRLDLSRNDEGTFLEWLQPGGLYSYLQIAGSQIVVNSNRPTFKGLKGNNYYGANYDDNTYVQKKYVDDKLQIITEEQIKGTRISESVATTKNIDLDTVSDFHYTMTADTAFTFTNTPTGTQVRRCKLRLTGEFAPSWTQAGLQVFGDGYDGTKWNDILVEMWLDGTIKGLLIFQQRETA